MEDYPMLFLSMSTCKDLGHLPCTQGYSGLVSGPRTATQRPQDFRDRLESKFRIRGCELEETHTQNYKIDL